MAQHIQKRRRIGSRQRNRQIVLCIEGDMERRENSEETKENAERGTDSKNTGRNNQIENTLGR